MYRLTVAADHSYEEECSPLSAGPQNDTTSVQEASPGVSDLLPDVNDILPGQLCCRPSEPRAGSSKVRNALGKRGYIAPANRSGLTISMPCFVGRQER